VHGHHGRLSVPHRVCPGMRARSRATFHRPRWWVASLMESTCTHLLAPASVSRGTPVRAGQRPSPTQDCTSGSLVLGLAGGGARE